MHDAPGLFKTMPKAVISTLVILFIVLSAQGIVKTVNEVKRGGFIGQELDRVHTITVQGEGELQLEPDVAMVDLSVETNGKELGTLQTENSRKMNDIMEFLESQGVEEKDLKTTNYNIFPQYDYPRSGSRIFQGYRITQTVNVKIRDFDKIGTIFDQAVNRGANQVSGLRFDIDEKDELIEQARGEAIEDAQDEAKKLARQLGVNLVRIVSFNGGGRDYYPEYRTLNASFAQDEAGFGGAAPSIAPGETEIRSSVSITYEIN